VCSVFEAFIDLHGLLPFVNFKRFTKDRLRNDSRSCQTSGVLQQCWRVSHWTKLAEATRKFLKMARDQGRPFFHNVNCYDPHRTFIGIRGTNDLAGGESPSRWIKPEEVTRVPGFLEDLPNIRRELAGYYTNVRRLGDAVGAVLAVLKEEGSLTIRSCCFMAATTACPFPSANPTTTRTVPVARSSSAGPA
jgi:hypothetical protein